MNDSQKRRFYAVGEDFEATARGQDNLAEAGQSSMTDEERTELHQLAQQIKTFAGGEPA